MEENSTEINFSCQRCCQPLRLDSTFNPISKGYFTDLISHNSSPHSATTANNATTTTAATTATTVATGAEQDTDSNVITWGENDDEKSSTSNADDAGASPAISPRKGSKSPKQSAGVVYKTIVPIRRIERRPDCDYSVINDSTTAASINAADSGSIVHSASSFLPDTDFKQSNLKLQIQLFDILSDQSDVDHPLCEECADFVIKQMDHHLTTLSAECADYQKLLTQMTFPEETSDKEIDELRAQLKSMQMTQASKIKELRELNKEQKSVEEDVERHINEYKRLKAEEDKYWHEYNNVKFSFYQCEEENQTLENKLRYAKEYYNKLKKANVFNSTFHIWYNGPFGTINGFRLGRIPSVQVDWHEINAGWGQCAMLLSAMANKINLTFQRYKIVPYGNYSFIESLEDKSKQLPLYSSGGIKYYFNQKFDQAMIAFLDCLQQLNQELHRQDSEFKLPYEMDGKGNLCEKNEKYSIKVNINTEEKWTKALRFMLTNLKWALAWVASKHAD